MRGLVLSLLVVLVSALVVLQGCRPLVRQEPVNEAERAVTGSGIQVIAAKGEKRGFCMLKSHADDAKNIELLTTRGSLNDKQIEKVLNSLGIWEQVNLFLGALVMGGGFGAVLGTVLASAPLSAVVLPIGVFAMGHSSLVLTVQQRDKRMRKVISDTEEQVFNDKKMQKFIDALRSTDPAHEGGCDHIKDKLKSKTPQAS